MEIGYVQININPQCNGSLESRKGRQYDDFYLRFCQKVSLEYPFEFNNEPGEFPAYAYDVAWSDSIQEQQNQQTMRSSFVR